MKTLVILTLLFTFSGLSAQALVYTPKNPNFGGNSYNYQWLLSSADAQNSFEDPDGDDAFDQKTQLESFKENLNAQILSQLSRKLFEDEFGDGPIEAGRYNFGGLAVDVYPSNGGLIVDILDTETGEQTQVVVPN